MPLQTCWYAKASGESDAACALSSVQLFQSTRWGVCRSQCSGWVSRCAPHAPQNFCCRFSFHRDKSCSWIPYWELLYNIVFCPRCLKYPQCLSNASVLASEELFASQWTSPCRGWSWWWVWEENQSKHFRNCHLCHNPIQCSRKLLYSSWFSQLTMSGSLKCLQIQFYTSTHWKLWWLFWIM